MRTPHEPRREPCQVGSLTVVALAAVVLLIGTGERTAASEPRSAAQATWRGLVAEHDARVAAGQRMLVVLEAPSLAERVAAAGGRADEDAERRWTKQALAAQDELFSRLAGQGIAIEPEFRYARVLNGFAAALDPRAVALLERAPEVEGVYPVRIAYPASLTPAGRAGLQAVSRGQAPIALPGFDGKGVTIALLDTGVDRAHRSLGGRVRRGIDVLTGDRSASAEAHPDDPSQFERHGTQMAGILVGDAPEAGLLGVAPQATVMPVRVAGWQRDAEGGWGVYSRTDQVIAGLERAVDPNGDGDAHDGARITLVGVVEPYAAFADGPTAEAVEGAFRLDSLVVVPAGNDGRGGPGHGVIAGPGGSPAALTVGAADLRPETAEVRALVRAGLEVKLARAVSLAGSVAPRRSTTLAIGLPRRPSDTAAPRVRGDGPAVPALRDFFGADGLSLVAGRAALVEGGDAPLIAVENAAEAGAHAVLLYGDHLPAGALGVHGRVAVPVVGIPRAVAEEVAAAVRSGAGATVSLGSVRSHRNDAVGRIAGFSSHGLAFDGRVKPEIAAPGVALATAEPGVDESGSPRFGTVNGSSAAAATVAGAAALLAQARRGVDARALKSLLVGPARPLPGDPVRAQGAGVVDVGAAAALEIVVEPTTLAFEWATGPGWRGVATLAIRNVSGRSIALSVGEDGRPAGVTVTATPARLTLAPRRQKRVTLRVRATSAARGLDFAEGAVRIQPDAGMAARVPWTVVFRRSAPSLISKLRLSPTRVRPSDAAPAALSLQVGAVLGSAEVQAVSRLDIELTTASGKELGLLTRVRNLIPGQYLFGLTGRGPGGQLLSRGRYRLRLVAVPTSGRRPTQRTLAFSIVK